jgi:hypothetical protein
MRMHSCLANSGVGGSYQRQAQQKLLVALRITRIVLCTIGPYVRRLERRTVCCVVLRTCVKMSALIRGENVCLLLQV